MMPLNMSTCRLYFCVRVQGADASRMGTALSWRSKLAELKDVYGVRIYE